MNDLTHRERRGGIVGCENCGGTGVLLYNPNLNPNSFAGTATGKCTRCGGTGIEETANKRITETDCAIQRPTGAEGEG